MRNNGTVRGDACVYLFRHGDSRRDSVKRYIGRTDHPLNEAGRAQAEYWRKELSGVKFGRCYASELRRSVETAKIIVEDRGMQVVQLPGLTEISMGEWDGLPMDEIRTFCPEEYVKRGVDPAGHEPPGGESFHQVRDRVVPLFERILNETEGPILVVGHAGVNRVVLCHFLGMPLENLFRLGQDYGCMNLVTRAKGCIRVEAVNSRPWFACAGEPNHPVKR